MRRSAIGGITWVLITCVHAFALVSVGVALRMLVAHAHSQPPPEVTALFAFTLALQYVSRILYCICKRVFVGLLCRV